MVNYHKELIEVLFFHHHYQVNPQAWLRMSLRNGSITWVTISPKGRVHVKSIGDAGHLPAELLTTH